MQKVGVRVPAPRDPLETCALGLVRYLDNALIRHSDDAKTAEATTLAETLLEAVDDA